MKSRISALLASVAALACAAPVWADTADVKTQSWVRVKKTGAHCVDDPNCMNRYHPAIQPVATARPGQLILFETRDAVDADFTVDSQPKDLAAVDLNLVHPMTGPVYIEGAKRGDVLAVTLVDVDPDEYGYTLIVPGFGFLRDLYTEPYIANWRLNRMEAVSDQLPGVAIPMNAFMGSVGTLPGPAEVDVWLERETRLGEAGGIALPPQPTGALPAAVCGPNGSNKDKCLRTIPPRENGGNMDIKQMVVGTTLLLPCYIDGCGLFVGDVHYAQGDGEVSGTAIEMGAKVTVRTQIRRGMLSMIRGGPHFEGGSQLKKLEPDRFYATVGYPLKKAGEIPPQHKYLDSAKIAPLSNLNEDLVVAARSALVDMIDWLQKNKGMTREQAYVFASVACDLRIGNVVDVPNYAVSTICPLEVFQK
jgi:formamidase